MKNKKIYFFASFLVLALLSFSIVSADLTFEPTSQTVSANHGDSATVTFNLVSDQDYSSLTWTGTSSHGSWTSFPGLLSIINGANETLSAVFSVPAYSTGSITGYLNVTANDSTKYTLPVTFNIANSASLSLTTLQNIERAQNGTINVTNTGNVALTNINLTASGVNVLFSDNGFSLTAGNSRAVTVSLADEDDLTARAQTITITAKDLVNGTSDSETMTATGSFCSAGEIGSGVTIEYIKDKSALENDWEWKPLDNIQIDVKVENTGDSDNDFTVVLALFDQNGEEVEVAVDEDDLEQDVSLDEDQSKKITFNFQVSADVEEASNYRIFAKIFEEGNEDELCLSEVADGDSTVDVEIAKDTHDVIVSEVDGISTTTCDSNVELKAKVYNIGNSDEEKIKIQLYSPELGIKIEKEITDLDEGDSDTITFNFAVPKNASEKQYKFVFSAFFDYDEDDDEYDKESDTEDDFDYLLNVLGNCQASLTSPTISATLSSSAKIGEEMIVTVTITNPGATTDFIVSAANYDTWTELVSIEPQIVNIPSGTSKQVTVKLKPTESGSQTFNLNVVYGGNTKQQAVSVNVAGQTGGVLSNLFAGSSNILLYVVAGVFLILIIIIIILIIKFSGSKDL